MRPKWIHLMDRVARPVLEASSVGQLKKMMPIRGKEVNDKTFNKAHLEAVGRTLAGIAPWLELESVPADEAELQASFRKMALSAIDQITRPGGPDECDFANNHAIVDGAFLAHALLRAPNQLAASLSDEVRSNVLAAFEKTRIKNRPHRNNWLLFSAIIEAGRDILGAEPDYMRLDYAIHQHEQWYKGDGVYGDGCHFHMDYYNSYVIHPMLVDLAERYNEPYPSLKGALPKILKRFSRYCEIQERMIGPDGHFPPVGRSLTYRAGAFQALAQAALQGRLPESLHSAGVRCALNAVIEKTLSPAGTFDEQGWLKPGLAGNQPGLGENYINTGSLYLCCAAFLPLGLPPDDPFWTEPDRNWTSKLIWQGDDFPLDKAKD